MSENVSFEQINPVKISKPTDSVKPDATLPPIPTVTKTTLFRPSLLGGRFTRLQYFLYLVLGNFIVTTIAAIVLFVEQVAIKLPNLDYWDLHAIESFWWKLSVIGMGVSLLFTYCFLMPIAVKRAHDIGHKGIIVIVTYSLYVIIAFYCINFSYLGWTWLLTNIGNIPLTVYAVILLFKDSQKGINKYGTSTKYPTQDSISVAPMLSQQVMKKRWKEVAFVPGVFLLCVAIAFLCVYVTPSQCALRELEARGLVKATAFGLIYTDNDFDHNYKADKYAHAPLHHAAEEGNIEIVKLLIQAGADVNSRVYWNTTSKRVNMRGWGYNDTPLDVAYRFNQPEVVKLLLQAGAHAN